MKINIENPIERVPSEGKKLYEVLFSHDLVSLRLRKENLEKLREINSLIIIGSSWSGKTTVRNILADVASENFDFPKRVITREQRPNDNLEENEFAVDLDDLKSKVGSGIIWQRDLGEKIEYYGFKMPEENHLPVYSGNNALVRERNSLVQEPGKNLVDNSLVILIYAPDGERVIRNQKREGEYLDDKPKQKEIRASDRAISMYPEAHILVKNYDSQDKNIQRDDLKNLLQIIDSLKN